MSSCRRRPSRSSRSSPGSSTTPLTAFTVETNVEPSHDQLLRGHRGRHSGSRRCPWCRERHVLGRRQRRLRREDVDAVILPASSSASRTLGGTPRRPSSDVPVEDQERVADQRDLDRGRGEAGADQEPSGRDRDEQLEERRARDRQRKSEASPICWSSRRKRWARSAAANARRSRAQPRSRSASSAGEAQARTCRASVGDPARAEGGSR